MGLFSSKKKVTVNTTVQRIFEDAQIPDSVVTGLNKGIINSTDLVENMLEDLAGSIGIRVNTGMGWIKRAGYFWGIPQSKVANAIDAWAVVLQQIRILEGGRDVSAMYNNYGPMNSIHWALQYALQTWGWNPETNELPGLSAVKGAKVYLSDAVPIYSQETVNWMNESSDKGLLDNWGYPPNSGYTPSKPYNLVNGMGALAKNSPYEVDASTLDDFVRFSYEWVNAQGMIERASVRVLMVVAEGSDWHQVRYRRENGTQGFFTYQQGKGTYPSIDGIFTINYTEMGNYIPWCYFRYDNKRVYDIGIKPYEDAKKWAKYLGVDYDGLDDGVHADHNVGDVAQVILFFGIRPNTQNQDELNYLFEYMLQLQIAAASQKDKAQNIYTQLGDYSSANDQLITIQDAYFRMDFGFSGIKYERKAGTVADVGKLVGTRLNATYNSGPTQVTQPAFRYQKQVMDNVYDEVTIFNPKLNYQSSSKKGFVAGIDDEELLIPIDISTLSQLSVRAKEQVLTRGMYMCVNTVIETKTPWYASGVFKAIMIIVAVVITVYSAGTAWQTIVGAAALGVTALAIALIQMIVVSMAVNYAVKLFVKELGPEIGILAAIAAAAYGSYQMANNNVWGERLLAVSNGLTTEASNAQKEELNDILQDFASALKNQESAFKSLNETQTELGLNPTVLGFDGLDFVGYRPTTIFGESSTDYYNRTVHAGNIGAASLDLVSNYFDVKLNLPELSDTLSGDFANG